MFHIYSTIGDQKHQKIVVADSFPNCGREIVCTLVYSIYLKAFLEEQLSAKVTPSLAGRASMVVPSLSNRRLEIEVERKGGSHQVNSVFAAEGLHNIARLHTYQRTHRQKNGSYCVRSWALNSSTKQERS